jgi:hypothetical protein
MRLSFSLCVLLFFFLFAAPSKLAHYKYSKMNLFGASCLLRWKSPNILSLLGGKRNTLVCIFKISNVGKTLFKGTVQPDGFGQN